MHIEVRRTPFSSSVLAEKRLIVHAFWETEIGNRREMEIKVTVFPASHTARYLGLAYVAHPPYVHLRLKTEVACRLLHAARRIFTTIAVSSQFADCISHAVRKNAASKVTLVAGVLTHFLK